MKRTLSKDVHAIFNRPMFGGTCVFLKGALSRSIHAVLGALAVGTPEPRQLLLRTPPFCASGSCALWPSQTQLDWHVSCAGAAESERTTHSFAPAARSSAQHGGFNHRWSGSHTGACRSLLDQAVLCLYVFIAYCYCHACWHQRLLRVVPFFVIAQATASSAQP